MRNLIVCCDGTWNTADQEDHGVPVPTNVAKVYNAVVKDETQLAYYHPGVGTDGHLIDKVLGGSTGEGLDRNIKSAYQWLASHWKQDDNIFLFGFSRGAYTVRSLCGLIAHGGLLDLTSPGLSPSDAWARVDAVFEGYRTRTPFTNSQGFAFHNAPEGSPGADAITIHFLGVWDTVGALGIPVEFPLVRMIKDRGHYEFHDTRLGSKVANARHAVALDEKRGDFVPTLWTNSSLRPGVKQMWFPGVHSDVGGGYPQTGLSNGALRWMLDEAADCSLRVRGGIDAQIVCNSLDVLHDSCNGVYKTGRTLPRQAVLLDKASVDEGHLHPSALERHSNPPITEVEYWPTRQLSAGDRVTVSVYAAQKWNATGIFLQAGKTYRMAASGEWLDAGVKFSPAGGEIEGHHISDIARLSASALGMLEKGVNAATHGHSDFFLTRRSESAPWLALIGYVANGIQADSVDGPPGEIFAIGGGCEFKPAADGYLYAYANDAWQAYANNHGSVSLTVALR